MKIIKIDIEPLELATLHAEERQWRASRKGRCWRRQLPDAQIARKVLAEAETNAHTCRTRDTCAWT